MIYIEVACRSMLGMVLVMSAGSKIWGRSALPAFVAGLTATTLVSSRHAPAVAAFTVVAEFTAVALLASSKTALAGFILTSAMLAVFAGGILIIIRRKVTAPCLCFGRSNVSLGTRQLVRNAILFGVANIGLAVTLLGTGPSDPLALLMAGLTGVILGSIIARLDDLISLLIELK